MEAFFEEWITGLESLAGELVSAPRDRPDLLLALTTRTLDHYREYYEAKSRLASRDVLAAFSPQWLTPFERSFLWIAGWKPSLAFRLLSSALGRGEEDHMSNQPPDGPLTAEQQREVKDLAAETAAAERALAAELATLQESVALPAVLGLARGARDGDARAGAAEALLGALERLLGSADGLRARTVERLVQVLTPAQTAAFLAAAAHFYLRMHRWGMRRGGGSG